MNPFLPPEYCVPDGEVRVFGNRCYLYGSYDIEGRADYCSHCYHVFSAPLNDLENWTDHGVSFISDGPGGKVSWSKASLFAPDVIEKNGKYYLYFCMEGGCEGVAVSDRPEGPFENARQLMHPADVNGGAPLQGIDPSVFVDDDGTAYFYWGQFHLQAAKLKENMTELEEGTYVESLIDESTHWFHEGSSMRKFNGRYYLMYCSLVTGRANTLDYAVGDSPLGPFAYCGTIINNRACDPESWNIHGSMQVINGENYVFYHRSSNCSRFSRRACAERFTFDDQGKILPVEMTSMGFSGSIPANGYIPASAVCERTGGCYLTRDHEDLILKDLSTAEYAAVKYLDFMGTEKEFSVELKAYKHGKLTLRLDSLTELPLTQIEFAPGEDWKTCTAHVTVPKGTHGVYLSVHGDFFEGILCDLKGFYFR